MQPRVLFLSLLNDVGSDRIVAAMGRLGCECAVIGPRDAFAARSQFAGTHFRLPRVGGAWLRGFRLAARLRRIADLWRPDLIIPLDDSSARALRCPRVAAAHPDLAAVIERSFGAAATYETICSREKLIEVAAALGMRTPRQETVATLGAARRVAAGFGYPVVLKREQTCGGFGVTIVGDETALVRAFKQARRKAVVKRMLQTALGLGTADQNALVLQEYVAGPLAFRIAACADGKVLDAISFSAEYINPPVTGASTVLRPLGRVNMDEATRALVATLGCSGLVSLDFIVSATGACLIELNPRPVASGHLGALYGHDIYQALVDDLRGVPVMASATLAEGPETIALFPRELDRDPLGALLGGTAAAFHDIPWHDPDVIEEYAGWLERRHPTRTAEVRRHLPPHPSGQGRPLSQRPFAGTDRRAKRRAPEARGDAIAAAPR